MSTTTKPQFSEAHGGLDSSSTTKKSSFLVFESQNGNLENQNRSLEMNADSTDSAQKRNFYCSDCKKSFSQKEGFIKHRVRMHGVDGMRMFICSYCPKEYKSEKIAENHLRRDHPNEFKERSEADQDTAPSQIASSGSYSPQYCRYVCKSKNCIHRDKHLIDQAIQTGCICKLPNETCTFCKRPQQDPFPKPDDSECVCIKRKAGKIYRHKIIQTGCTHTDCGGCDPMDSMEDKSVRYKSRIWCAECDMRFGQVQSLRDHLREVHNSPMDFEVYRLPNMDAFKKWKHDMERKELSSFTLRHGARKTVMGLKFFYVCHRSGRYISRVNTPRQRMLKSPGTCKLGIVCTAAIYCEECPNEVIVKYCPHHYGHGKETSFVQLSSEEQAAIQENVSNGIPFENLLDDIRDCQSSTDHFQLYLLKKRDIRFINNAFNAVEYNPGLSDADSVDQWVRNCSQMEESPILYYRQEEFANSEEDFLLIIMTEFQKQILLSSDKQVVCVDSLYRRKGGRFYLTVLFIMDEYDIAFPVAYCISSKVDKSVITQFFTSIKESTGPLECLYFMSDSERFYYDAWIEVMSVASKWLWSMWYVDNRIRVQLRIFKGNIMKRAEVYKTMRMLLECQNQNVFQSMFKNYVDSLMSDATSKNLGNFILQKYGNNAHMWAYCFRKDIKLSTNIHLEVMHRTFRYCCREGRKKRLDKFIFVIMKLVRYKMLDRLTMVLDEEKISLAVEAINMFHSMGLEIPTENISSLSDKIWLIRSDEDENVYVTREFETCPEHCNLKCTECDICVHMYSCSCVHSMINANLCQHIHAVMWKFLTPHFSPPESPVPECDMEMEDVSTTDVIPHNCSELLDNVLKRTHDLYKKVRANKCSLNKESLTAIMKRVNESVDICTGKPIPEEKKPESPSKNAVYVINPYVKKDTQPLLLPKALPTILPNNKQMSQYVLLVQNK